MGRFVLSQKPKGYRFVLQAGNYEPILSSELYESKAAAQKGIESVRKNSQRAAAFETKTAKNGQFHFVLKATNGQIIGTSELYTTEAGSKKGIEAVKKNGDSTRVVEA
jgi:uncharacterized protein YegP (UPF0339 family)